MATAPTWQAPTTGQAPKADHINQLLGPHTSVVLCQGVQTAGKTTSGATATSTNGLYLAQSFTTAAGQTAIGTVTLSLTTATTTGALLPSTTVHLYANTGGAPSGPPLASTTVTAEYANGVSGGTDTVRITVPLPATGLTPSTTYWLVVDAAGNSTSHFTWRRSDQTSGASTSPDGASWTGQAYGFTFTIQDQTATGLPHATWEDSGARWTVTVYSTLGLITSYHEYTAGQTTTGYLQSDRTYSYTAGQLTGVA